MVKKIPHIEGLEDWELDLLFEVRLPREAGALEPVLETMSSLMIALMLEAEQRAQEERWARLTERIGKQRSQKGQLAEAMKSFRPTSPAPDIVAVRRSVAARMHSGRLLGYRASRFTEEDARWARFQQIARAARITATNRLRSYVDASA